MFELGTIVSYRGRVHVVVGLSPIGVAPPLVEIEDSESGRIRSVAADQLQPFAAGTKRLPVDREERNDTV